MAKTVFNPYTSAVATLTLLLLAAGCASKSLNGVNPDPASSNDLTQIAGSTSAISSLSLIARDFAHVLPQISELRPEQIILSVLPEAHANADFAEALRQALFLEGYAVRVGSGNFSSTRLTFKITESEGQESGLLENEPQQAVKLYQLSIGNISLRRRYSERPGGQVQPVSAMEARGLDPTEIVVDESIFNNTKNYPIADNTTQAPQTTGNITPVSDPNQPEPLPELTHPLPGSQFSGSDVTFRWDDNGIERDQWFLRVGLSEGTAEFAEVRLTNPAMIEYQVSRLPTNGVPIFVEFSFLDDGVWTVQRYEYTAFDDNAVNSDDTVVNDNNASKVAGEHSVKGNVATDAAILVDDDDAPGLTSNTDTASQSAASKVRFSPLPFDGTANFRDLGHSNYHDLFRETVVVDIQIFDFADNSSVLMPDAIARLKRMAENLKGSDDLISVIGTSHGRVAYPAAREELARNRAIAVRNSLLGMGVELDNIYPEASWSGSNYDTVLPRRAAVVEVKRLVAASATSN